MNNLLNLIRKNIEWSILLGGIILLAVMDPGSQERSFCLFDFIGIFCPGEGLGRSISYIFRGMWTEAWSSNPAGYLAVPVLSFRIVYIFLERNNLNSLKNYGKFI